MAYKRKRVSYKKKASKKPYRKTVSKGRTIKMVKQVVMKVAETKRQSIAWNKVEVFHNVCSFSQLLWFNDPNAMPSNGVLQAQRVRDRINCIGYEIRLLIGQKGDRPNVNFRYCCFSLPKGTVLLANSYNQIFENVTNNVLLDDLNKDTTKLLKQGWLRPNQAGLAATGKSILSLSVYSFHIRRPSSSDHLMACVRTTRTTCISLF